MHKVNARRILHKRLLQFIIQPYRPTDVTGVTFGINSL